MNELMNPSMTVALVKRRNWSGRIALAAILLTGLTLVCLLLLGVSPLGRFLQSIDWVREAAGLLCK